MAKIRLIKGKSTPTARNFKAQLPIYLTYLNSAILLALLIIKHLD